MARSAGLILHPTSLPGPFGIGDLGPEAEKFLDWAASAGQSLWQILPLHPTGPGDSPYGASSAFAGNPLLLSPERLCEEELEDFRIGPERTSWLSDWALFAALKTRHAGPWTSWRDGLSRRRPEAL